MFAPLALAFALAATGNAVIEAVLEPVEVVARRGFDPETGAGSSVDVAAARRTLASTSELLGREAGVTLRSSGGFLQTVAIRGSASNQVQLYLNGLPLPSSLSGALSPSLVPPEALARIDVYRGSVPARFARSPLAGAVDLVTREPAREVSVRAGAGSFGRREGALMGGARIGRVDLVGGVAGHASRGDFPFRDNHGTPGNPDDDRTVERRNNDTEALEGFMVAGAQLGRGTLRGHALVTGANQGIPGFGFAQALRARLDQRLGAAAADYVLPLAGWTLAPAVFGGELREHFHDPRGEITSAGNDLLNVTDQGGVRLSAERDGTHVRPEFALEAETLRFRSVRKDTELPSYRVQRASAAASARVTVERAVLTATAHGELHRQAADNELSAGRSLGKTVRTQALPAVLLGASYPLGAVRLLANAGTGYRIPTAQEQFGDRGIQVGNPALRPERGRFADAGLQWGRTTRQAAWSTDLRAFVQSFKDLITVYQTAPRTASAINFDAVAAAGAEWQAAATVRRFRLTANLTYNRIENVSRFEVYDGKQLPGRPVWEGGGDAAFTTRFLTPYYALRAQGDYYLDPVNSAARRVRSRAFHDAGLTVTPLAGLQLTAGAENITGVRSYDYIGYPLPGRSFSLVAQYRTSTP